MNIKIFFIFFLLSFIKTSSINIEENNNNNEIKLKSSLLTLFQSYKNEINSYGYDFEEHKITTSDGYILSLWRIPGLLSEKKNNNLSNKKVVLLQHGLLDDCWTWFALKNTSLPFQLSNNNYDVWISNIRGNLFSSEHINQSSSDPFGLYWNFSFTDMADVDLPSIITYIKNTTNVNKIDYIGHSQGSMIFFLHYMNDPIFMENSINKLITVGTVPNVNNAESFILKILELTGLMKLYPFENVFKLNFFIGDMLSLLCDRQPNLCWNLLAPFFETKETNNINPNEILAHLVKYEPGGTSKKNLLHWIQIKKSKKYAKFDYGSKEENMKIYGQEFPPEYDVNNLKKWEIKSLMFLADKDPFSNPDDVYDFVDKIEKKDEYVKFEFIENYNHIDFLWAENAKEFVYPKIIEFLNN